MSVHSRRAAIISYITRLEKDEIALFLELLSHPLNEFVMSMNEATEKSKETNETEILPSHCVGFPVQFQYLSVLSQWLKAAPTSLLYFLEMVIEKIWCIFKYTHLFMTDPIYRQRKTIDTPTFELAQKVHKACILLFIDILSCFGENTRIQNLINDW